MDTPEINVRLVPNYTWADIIKDGACLHHAATVTTTMDEVHRTFCNREASTQWGVAAGVIDQYLIPTVIAWAAGNNYANAHLEHVEVANSGGSPGWPVAEESIDTLVELLAWRFAMNPHWGKARWKVNVFEHSDFYPTFCAGVVGDRGQEICDRINEVLEGKAPVEEKKWTGVRLAGDNRYGTNTAVVRWVDANRLSLMEAESPWETIVVYRDGADALAATNIPNVVRVMVNANPESNGGEKKLLAEHKGAIKRFLVVGGLAVLPDAVINRLNEAAGL